MAHGSAPEYLSELFTPGVHQIVSISPHDIRSQNQLDTDSACQTVDVGRSFFIDNPEANIMQKVLQCSVEAQTSLQIDNKSKSFTQRSINQSINQSITKFLRVA